MLGLFTYSEICQSLLCIADPQEMNRYGYTSKGLRLGLQARAQQLQPNLPLWDTEATVLVASSRIENLLRDLFTGHSDLNDLTQNAAIERSSSSEERMLKLGSLRQALNLMQNLDANLHEIFNASISCIFTSGSHSAGGGTSSATPGVIWANLRNHWSTWDTLEFLVHELTHNLMFFDEFSALHYHSHDALINPETFTQSAILKRRRPLDKVLHSIAVGIAILNLRANTVFQQTGLDQPLKLTTGIHPDSVSLVRQLQASVNSIFENRAAMNLLSTRGLELLEKSKKRIDEFASITFSLVI